MVGLRRRIGARTCAPARKVTPEQPQANARAAENPLNRTHEQTSSWRPTAKVRIGLSKDKDYRGL